jgi:hypothetical protein
MQERVFNQTSMQGLGDKMTANRKMFLLFIAVLFAACLLVGCASVLISFPFIGWLQLAGLVCLGTVYAIITQNKFAEQDNPTHFVKAVYIALALLLAFSVVYFVKQQFNFLTVFALSCAFLLPATVLESWHAFTAIPTTKKDIWYYEKDLPPASNIRYIENTKVQLRIIVDEAKVVQFPTSLPTTLELEKAIYYVIRANDPFHDGDGTFFKTNDEPYGWVFYTRNLFSKTYFVPDDTIFENHIKQHTVIYAERVSQA